MAVFYKSPRRKRKSGVKQRQSSSPTTDSGTSTPIVACETAEKILWGAIDLRSAAGEAQRALDDDIVVQASAQKAANAALSLLIDLAQLKKFLLLNPSIEAALEDANDRYPVSFEGRLYPSYCYAAFCVGMTIYVQLITHSNVPSVVQLLVEVKKDPDSFVIRSIEGATIIEHWREISKKIVDQPWVTDLYILGNQITYERKRLSARREGRLAGTNPKVGCGDIGRPRTTEQDIEFAEEYLAGLKKKKWNNPHAYANERVGDLKKSMTLSGKAKATRRGLIILEKKKK